MRFTSAAAALCLITVMTVQSSVATLPATTPPVPINQSTTTAVKDVSTTGHTNLVKDLKTVTPRGQHKNLTPQQKLAYAQERVKFWQERVTKLQGATGAPAANKAPAGIAALNKPGQKAGTTTTTAAALTPTPTPQPAAKPVVNTPTKA
ncbi:hypothetical protein H4R34_004352 [Dimargaris verticillata]|uniref:Secreted protein n=1 Tax=Dimargaris verticillata TaxID=2761393 RepID=A0A9W8B0S2_9FUNG|nr:hypothetical protein H4R34_004352 [Dimargaris verticillata]